MLSYLTVIEPLVIMVRSPTDTHGMLSKCEDATTRDRDVRRVDIKAARCMVEMRWREKRRLTECCKRKETLRMRCVR